jgi:hypothetical protein
VVAEAEQAQSFKQQAQLVLAVVEQAQHQELEAPEQQTLEEAEAAEETQQTVELVEQAW